MIYEWCKRTPRSMQHTIYLFHNVPCFRCGAEGCIFGKENCTLCNVLVLNENINLMRGITHGNAVQKARVFVLKTKNLPILYCEGSEKRILNNVLTDSECLKLLLSVNKTSV